VNTPERLRRGEQGAHVVTDANLFELAAWCGGTVVTHHPGRRYIEIPHVRLRAYVGDTIERWGSAWGVQHSEEET
jgi:hypothetical protein